MAASVLIDPEDKPGLMVPVMAAHRMLAFGDAGRRALTRLGQPDGISPSRMAEMLEVDKAGPKVRC